MSKLAVKMNTAEIVWSDTLEQSVRYLIERSKSYETVILLYEDDRSSRMVAAWAEKDRLQLPTRQVGEADNGIEVHSFGLDSFPPGTVVEVALRPSRQDSLSGSLHRTAYRSLLNEISLIAVKVYSKFSSLG